MIRGKIERSFQLIRDQRSKIKCVCQGPHSTLLDVRSIPPFCIDQLFYPQGMFLYVGNVSHDNLIYALDGFEINPIASPVLTVPCRLSVTAIAPSQAIVPIMANSNHKGSPMAAP